MRRAARRWVGVGSVSTDRGGAEGSAGTRQVLRQRVASSPSRVSRLCRGAPSPVRREAFLRRARAVGLARGDRVAGAPVVGQGLVVEQQRRPGSAQTPLQVPGQQAYEQMRPDPALLAVADGTHPDVEPLEGPEPPFDVGQPLVGAHRVFGQSPHRGGRCSRNQATVSSMTSVKAGSV